MIHRMRKSMLIHIASLLLLQIALLVSGSFSLADNSTVKVLTLAEAIEAAHKYDPWLAGNRHTENAVKSMSIAAGTYPDPKITLALANFPTDSFDINQEPMTQVKVGITQMIPRGESVAIKREQLKVKSEQFPFLRQDRKAKLAVKVGLLWLEAYTAQESLRLIEKDRPLFEQLADVAEASYSSALGKTRQQDIVRAQLELTRLDDRLTVLRQKKEMRLEMLSEWLSEFFIDQYAQESAGVPTTNWSNVILGPGLPDMQFLHPFIISTHQGANSQKIYELIAGHPSIKALQKKIDTSALAIDLANQSYKPQWGVSASYGYRDEDKSGKERADFLSIGVSFDLPFFTKNRQDKGVESAVSMAAAIKTQKWQLLRKMIAEIENGKAQLLRLSERQNLYQDQLIPQTQEQAEASLTAYTNDDGDFAEVVRARIAELNTQITALNIDMERQKAILKLNYYFMVSDKDIDSSDRHIGEMK